VMLGWWVMVGECSCGVVGLVALVCVACGVTYAQECDIGALRFAFYDK
jgi:hypothetical protein